MELTQQHNVPMLRFPDFTSSYNEFRCGELFNNSRAKGWDRLPIFSVTVDRGLVRRDSLEREITTNAAPEKNLKVSKGDLAYNMMRMWQGAVGLASEDGMVSPAYVVLSSKAPINSEYFYQSLYRKRSLYLLWAYSYGLTNDRLRLYFKDFSKIPCSVPAKNEQQKISSFFSSIDTKIEQLGKKKALLKQYKKGIMQKLFSQDIRFKNEQGNEYPDWVDMRLGNITDIAGGGTPSTANAKYWEGDIQWFTPTEIKTKYLSKSKRTITQLGLQKSSARLLPIGTLLLSTRATVGDIGIATQTCTTNQGFQSLKMKNENINEFWFYWIINNKKELIRRASGSTFLEINKTEISKIPVNAPHVNEQKKIADFLSSIDQKIELISSELELTKTFKKGLLQQMFI